MMYSQYLVEGIRKSIGDSSPRLKCLYLVEKCMVTGFGIDFGIGFGIDNIRGEQF